MIAGQIYTWVEVQEEIKKAIAEVEGGGGGPTAWDDITSKPAVIAAGVNAAAARAVIGAGTSNLGLGTTAGTALAGDTVIPAAPTWSTIAGKPAVVAEGANAAAARAAIGAGTSSLAIGTTNVTALKGDSFQGGLLTLLQITQAAYDALGTKVATTLYVIVG